MRETAKARQAWAHYLAMGPERSLEKLLAEYRLRAEDGEEPSRKPPTTRWATLSAWSSSFGWQARLLEIADREARQAEEREAAYRREIMEQGYALSHERVKALKALAEKLYVELTAEGEENRRWVRDVKQIGSGDSATRVDIERFNAAELEQLRGLLDDIAKEKGERQEKHEVTGPGGGPIQIVEVVVEQAHLSVEASDSGDG